jgi:hypothetical protein
MSINSLELYQLLIGKCKSLKGLKLKAEAKICYEFANHLRQLSLDKKLNGIWFHIPNEISANNNPAYGYLQACLGKMPGAPDYIFLNDKTNLLLEFKAGKNKQSENQILFEKWATTHNIPYHVVYSAKNAYEILEKNYFII